ncbi:MAG: hypothetical protein AB8B80_01270 [Marinicellaceae bacterium]
MYVNRHNKVVKQYGFSLWELSIVILIMIGLFVALVSVMPYIVKRENVEVDQSILVKVDDQLLGFIATYNRLPCPDSNNDGLEDCTSSSGSVPYKTLGLNEDYAGIGSIPIKYAVFRNSASMADLTNITNLFNPTDSHGDVTTINNINGLDFCSAIYNGRDSTFSTAYAHVILPDGSTSRAVPYVLVTAGLADLDGGTTPFEGRNESSALDFESANKVHNATYDDSVHSKTFDELASSLNCDTAQNSFKLLADAKATHTENVAQQENIEEGTDLAIIITVAQTALGVANTAMAVYNLVQGVILVAAAAAYLSGLIAACIASLGTSCGSVALGIAALVAAVIAVVTAGIALAANVAAVVIQVIAIVKLVDVSNRIGSAVTVPNPNSVTDPNTGETTSNSDLAVQAREQADQLVRDVAEKTINTRNDINNARGLSSTIVNLFNNLKNQTQALANTTAAVNDATFTTYANLANTRASSRLGEANSALSSLNTARGHAINAVTSLGASQTNVSNDFPPVVTVDYPNVDLPAVEANLTLTEPPVTSAAGNISSIQTNYTGIRNQAINSRNRLTALIIAVPALPANPTQAQIDARNARIATLNDARNKANAIINSIDRIIVDPRNPFNVVNEFSYYINLQTARIIAAESTTTDAKETITAAIDADENATYMEENVGGDNPNATTTTFGVAAGVDDILREADAKGVQR